MMAPFPPTILLSVTGRRSSRTALAIVLAIGSYETARADTPSRCSRFDEQAPIALDSLSAGQRSHARFIKEQATSISAKRGADGASVLIKLKSNDPKVATIAAYVVRPDGRLAALVLYTSGLNQTHSLVDLPSTFVVGANEPDGHTPGREESGLSYQFYDEGHYYIQLSDFVSRPLKSGWGNGATYRQSVTTGYSYGGLPVRCGNTN